MRTTLAWRHLPTRWLAFAGLLLLLSFVFASQLFWAGYVTPWTKAFTQEALYWLAWAVLAPLIFWMCRRLHDGKRAWGHHALWLLLGALAASVLHPAVAQAMETAYTMLSGGLSTAQDGLASATRPLHATAIRLAGINLPVYAGFVLAWYAATYYREMRDRELRSMELESLLHQSQLQALRSQLNPHFLFNTLHSIAELVHRDPNLAEQLILRLGELLRQVLQSSTRPDVPLSEELDFVGKYVEIERIRLGERLQVTWEVEPETLEVRVPSLILQPLVENAIRHGIAPVAGVGSLSIRARRDDGFLHLQVRDTGPGLASRSPDRDRGIGLSNTRLRLQRLYGERQRFELAGEGGLVVNVHIPLSTQ